jgi:hypothetical protein
LQRLAGRSNDDQRVTNTFPTDETAEGCRSNGSTDVCACVLRSETPAFALWASAFAEGFGGQAGVAIFALAKIGG